MSTVESSAVGAAPKSLLEKLGQPAESRIRHVIAVMSGKGGVGKSSLSALLAVSLAREGYRVGLLDADITGPSIPKLFGLKRHASAENEKIVPENGTGIKVICSTCSCRTKTTRDLAGTADWRSGEAVLDRCSGEIDYLVVDLPPGTGDAPDSNAIAP